MGRAVSEQDQAALRQALMRELIALAGLAAALLLLQNWDQLGIWARAAWQLAAGYGAPAAPPEPTREDWQAWRRDIARLDGERVDPVPS